MLRLCTLLAVALLLLTGCSPQAQQQSSDPEALARKLHPGLVAVSTAGRIQVQLESGEPTGGAPFALVRALYIDDPGYESYTVSYATLRGPDRRTNEYTWNVPNKTIVWTRVRSNGPHGVIADSKEVITDVDLSKLMSLASAGHGYPGEFAPFESE